MRSQAGRDEVTLDIAGALAIAVAMGTFAGLVSWMWEAILTGPVDWDWVLGLAIVTTVVVLVGRLTRRAR